jgi:hypothetical protein
MRKLGGILMQVVDSSDYPRETLKKLVLGEEEGKHRVHRVNREEQRRAKKSKERGVLKDADSIELFRRKELVILIK